MKKCISCKVDLDQGRKSKRCLACDREKRITSGVTKPEGWIRKTADMRSYREAYNQSHKEYFTQKRREWSKKNPERQREIERRKYYARKQRAVAIPKPSKGPEWVEELRKRVNTKYRVYKAIKKGTLVKLPCFVCGELRVEAHHPDYSLPLDVVWLCPHHHRLLHKESRN
jgi:hypothetical protein